MANELTNDPGFDAPPANHEGTLGIGIGIFFVAVFYAAIAVFPHAWMQRYFLGHPVCVGASILFSIACGILLIKQIRVSSERRLAAGLRDVDLSPPAQANSATDQWLLSHDAGRAAQQWVQGLAELPEAAKRSRLVTRLVELLQRQSGRVSTRHLSDDLREISGRDGDTAHNSLQLVRIIIWAIPMLGFLGTVVGITQTLGGLDFSDGTAAVDRLKSGLYVAFDTTALGLVLSVIAIFLQFPVEKAEQQLLGDIDRRIGNLLNAKLPADDAADNPAGQIAQLCDGIRVAVGESLASQTELWRQTIDEAHLHWQRIAEDNGQRIGDAIVQSLAPLLRDHAGVISQQTIAAGDQTVALREHSRWQREHTTVQQAHGEQQREQAADIINSQLAAVAAMQGQWERWTSTIVESTAALSTHQQSLASQIESLSHNDDLAEELLNLQTALDRNLVRISEANVAAQASIDSSAKGGISHAMMTLASAVEVLAVKLPGDIDNESSALPRIRRAA